MSDSLLDYELSKDTLHTHDLVGVQREATRLLFCSNLVVEKLLGFCVYGKYGCYASVKVVIDDPHCSEGGTRIGDLWR